MVAFRVILVPEEVGVSLLGMRLRGHAVQWFLLIRCEHLSLELDLFVDDLLHDSDKDVDHDELSVPACLYLEKEKPLESQVEALSVEELLQRTDIEYRI